MSETKNPTEHAESMVTDDELCSDAEIDAMTRDDVLRAYTIAHKLDATRAVRFLDWYTALPDNAEVKIGLAALGSHEGPRSIVVFAKGVTWHFQPTEVYNLIRGIETLTARWTVDTGRSSPKFIGNLVRGLRVCYKQLVDITEAEIEEFVEQATPDEYGYHVYDRTARVNRKTH